MAGKSRKRQAVVGQVNAANGQQQIQAAAVLTLKRKTPAELRLEQMKRVRASTQRTPEPSPIRVHEQENSVTHLALDYRAKQGSDQGHDFEKLKRPGVMTRSKSVKSGARREFRNITNITRVSQDKELEQAVEDGDISKVMATTMAPLQRAPSKFIAEAPPVSQQPATTGVQLEALPADWSLKTSARFVSTASFEWCHTVSALEDCCGLEMFVRSAPTMEQHSTLHSREASGGDDTGCLPRGSQFRRALLSWIHPEASFPSSLMTALTASAARGVAQDQEFLARRKSTWLDSFQSLYSMYRNGKCGVFYVRGQHATAMFLNRRLEGASSQEYCGYLTRSTRGLRAILAKEDTPFSMPLSTEKTETLAGEDIRELEEFEKSHPGQTSIVDTMAALDNRPESMLCFTDRDGVHGLYSFVLNFRRLLGPAVGSDEPVLLAPVAFRSACLTTPEVVCRRMQTAESSAGGGGEPEGALLSVKYSLELKGALLPPWVISRVCATLQRFQPEGLQASFAVEPLTEGLNGDLRLQPLKQPPWMAARTSTNPQKTVTAGLERS